MLKVALVFRPIYRNIKISLNKQRMQCVYFLNWKFQYIVDSQSWKECEKKRKIKRELDTVGVQNLKIHIFSILIFGMINIKCSIIRQQVKYYITRELQNSKICYVNKVWALLLLSNVCYCYEFYLTVAFLLILFINTLNLFILFGTW